MPNDKSVLIVDDDPQTLASMREALSDEFHLSYATSGMQALDATKRVNPGLILLDIRLPDLDGVEVCRRLKADVETAGIPVIFVTSLSETSIGVEGFEAGAVDFITKPIMPELVIARVKSHLSLVQVDRLQSAYNDAISMLAIAGEYNDTETGIHIRRMAAISACVAQHAGWTADRVQHMELAAAMHDIGKVGVPSAILQKPGPLDTEEWRVMRRHPKMGSDILSVSDAPVFQLASEIALGHHERWDGSGYPNGTAGKEIPESARIVALADVFDALTSVRPYKKAWSVDDAIAYIRKESGAHFDPDLVELFVGILPQVVAVKAKWDAVAQAS